jgi:Ca-activated chloride channel family protein
VSSAHFPAFDLSRPAHSGSGGRLVASDGRALPLAHASVVADAGGGLARVSLHQVFRNVHDEPLRVTYSLPLPADAAVSGFSFVFGDERVVGEIERRRDARERFEQALVEGHAAALLEQTRSSVFRQELGNVPPRSEVRVEIELDQRLVWTGDGGWEWRFPTVVAPRYLGAEGRVPDAEQVALDVLSDHDGPRVELALVVRDALPDGGGASSPTHALAVSKTDGRIRVGLAETAGVPLDRDVVVRWPAAAVTVGVSLEIGTAGPGRGRADEVYALLTLVPALPGSAQRSLARDLIVLIDTSGSMTGAPLAQAKAVVTALIDTLREADRLELIAFANRPDRFHRKPRTADARHRASAKAWVAKLRAGGGTEMHEGIREALRPLRADAQRQVLLVTDGLIGFEHEIVATIQRELPPGSRLHAVGVGPAVNASLIQPAARAGRGTFAIAQLHDDVAAVVRRLVTATTAPVLVDLEITGSALRDVAPARLPDLYARQPLLAALALEPAGGELTVRGRAADGPFVRTLSVPAIEPGEHHPAAAALYARERVEDLEALRASADSHEGLDAEIERIGLVFGIATRLTSWVAVTQHPGVDPRAPGRRERMPQALPYGLSAEGLGLRDAYEPQLEAALLGTSLTKLSVGVALSDKRPARLLHASRAAVLAASNRSRGKPRSRERARGWSLLSKLARRRQPDARRILEARLVHRDSELAVLEVDLDAPLRWEPPTTARVLLWSANGATRLVEVHLARTTSPAQLEKGHVVRVALRLPRDLGEPERVVLHAECELELVVARD